MFLQGCKLPKVLNGVWAGELGPGEPLFLICNEGYRHTGGTDKLICTSADIRIPSVPECIEESNAGFASAIKSW